MISEWLIFKEKWLKHVRLTSIVLGIFLWKLYMDSRCSASRVGHELVFDCFFPACKLLQVPILVFDTSLPLTRPFWPELAVLPPQSSQYLPYSRLNGQQLLVQMVLVCCVHSDTLHPYHIMVNKSPYEDELVWAYYDNKYSWVIFNVHTCHLHGALEIVNYNISFYCLLVVV